MNNLPVTLVTKDATVDPVDYKKIINSLRGPLYKWSWQQIADATGYNSKGWWRFVSLGERELDETAKNALRSLTEGELRPQPPSVTAVTTDYIHPDAAMYFIGELPDGGLSIDERVRRVFMVAGSDEITITANGTVQAFLGHTDSDLALGDTYAAEPPVTAVTCGGEQKQEPRRHRLSVAPDDYAWMRDNGYQSVSDMIRKLQEVSK